MATHGAERFASTPPGIGKAIFYSALAHIVLILLAFFSPEIPSSWLGKEKPLDVVWVELPKGTGEDITGIKESKGLPQTTIQETKELPEEKVAPPPLPPKVKAEKKIPPAKDDKDVMKEPSTRAKKEKKKVVYSDRAIRAALAKIDKELKDRTLAPEAAQMGEVGEGEGYKYGTGDKPVRVSRSDPAYLRYQAQVRAKIMRNWVVPGHYANMPGKKSPNARVHVTISASGHVLSTRWVRRSGDAAFDLSATRAIQRASPFPIPPEELKWEALHEGFLVEFDIRNKRS